MWQTARLSYCRQLNGVSFNTESHVVLFADFVLLNYTTGILSVLI
jgi:hypothetical protein